MEYRDLLTCRIPVTATQPVRQERSSSAPVSVPGRETAGSIDSSDSVPKVDEPRDCQRTMPTGRGSTEARAVRRGCTSASRAVQYRSAETHAECLIHCRWFASEQNSQALVIALHP